MPWMGTQLAQSAHIVLFATSNCSRLYLIALPFAIAGGPSDAERIILCAVEGGRVCTNRYRGCRRVVRPDPADPSTNLRINPPLDLWSACNYSETTKFSAPHQGFPLGLQVGAAVALPRSEPQLLLTLHKISSEDCTVAEVARSYDGFRWEAVAGHRLTPHCDAETGDDSGGTSSCTLAIAPADRGFVTTPHTMLEPTGILYSYVL